MSDAVITIAMVLGLVGCTGMIIKCDREKAELRYKCIDSGRSQATCREIDP